MDPSKFRQLGSIIMIALITTLMTFSFYWLGKFVHLADYFMVFMILFLSFTWLYLLHGRLLKIVTRSIKNIEKYSVMPFEKPNEKHLNSLFKKFKILNQLSQDYDARFKGALEKQSLIQNELIKLERSNFIKSHTLDTILKVSHLFVDLNNSKDYYSIILSSAIDVIANASKGSFLLYNPQSQRYEFQACVGYDLSELQKVTLSFEETFLFKNAQGNYNEPKLIKNVREFDFELLDMESNEAIEKAGGLVIKEALSSPIIIDNQVIAILNVDSESEDAFDENDKQLIHFFSSQIALALKNKYLVDETVNMSKFDKLTGAFNRNYFEKVFSAHRDYSLENMESYALVLCDLNYLKIINDTYGHNAGDLILKMFSQSILNHIRDSDVFSRIGGDEFVILLRNISRERAEEKMKRIYQSIEHLTLNHNGHELPVSFSYGISASPDDSMIYDILIKIADIRMYKFKENYKQDHPEVIERLVSL